MEKKIKNDENKNPKSVGKIGYNTAFKNNVQFKNKIFTKNPKLPSRTPLKSKMNIIEANSQHLYNKEEKNNKLLNYPLLKSISSHNIENKNFQSSFNNNLNNDETYNENALKDEANDFMHINENEIKIINDEEEINSASLQKPKLNVQIMSEINPFRNNENNYCFAAHFDDEGKKVYDDYSNSPDENDLDKFDI